MARKDLIRTTASAILPTGPLPLGEFDTFSGGNLTSADNKKTRGAGGIRKARGGRQDVEDVTIGREDDGGVNLKQLAPLRGRLPMTVTRTPLDDDKNPRTAEAITYTGILMSINIPDGDSDDDGEISMFELIISCDSPVS